jgi:hypothetical protein
MLFLAADGVRKEFAQGRASYMSQKIRSTCVSFRHLLSALPSRQWEKEKRQKIHERRRYQEKTPE